MAHNQEMLEKETVEFVHQKQHHSNPQLENTNRTTVRFDPARWVGYFKMSRKSKSHKRNRESRSFPHEKHGKKI